MIYIKKLTLPSELAEAKVIELEKRTCFNTFYPFKIFPEMRLGTIDFDSITMLYGGNGSGKAHSSMSLRTKCARLVIPNSTMHRFSTDLPRCARLIIYAHREEALC